MMKHWLISICGLQWVLIAFLACSGPGDDPPTGVVVVDPPPIRYEILYDRDSGECNVVTRSDNELISESLFHSTIVNECYEYTIENEVK